MIKGELLKGLHTDLKSGEVVDWAKLTKEMRILDTGKLYSEVGEDWQFKIDEAIASHQRVYLQLARGHDKTDRFAWWSMLWLSTTLASRGYAAGVDRDNAALFRDSSKKLKALHPDLFYAIDVQKNIVSNLETGSYIETISSDADSAYGLNFDLMIVNDFHSWPDEKFWEVLWTACGKKPGIRIWLESNALTLGTEGAHWVAKFRKWVNEKGSVLSESIINDRGIEEAGGKWWFFCPRGFLASWQKPQLDMWRDTLHPSAYRRLIENQDTSGEESFVSIEQVEACTIPTLTTFAGWETKEQKTGYVVTAVDLGLKKDATAIATVQSLPSSDRNSPPKYRLLALDIITGSVDDPVQLRHVEQVILSHRAKYFSFPILIDPWNAAEIIQKFGFIEEWPFTTAHVRELTQALYRAIADKNLQLIPHAAKAIQDGDEWDLQRELVNAVVKDCSYGQRVDHKSGGFSDRLMAVGMCIHYLSTNSVPHGKGKEEKLGDRDSWNGGKLIEEWNGQVKGNALLKI